MQATEKKQVLQAIDALGRRVTVADVAAKTGLPLHVANMQLNTVAAETNGHLQVATTGDIAYSFDLGFQNTYLASGFKRTLQAIWQKAFHIGFYLLRISFGIMLVLSLIIVVVLIVVVLFAINQRNDDSGGGGGGFEAMDFFDLRILGDLLWWGSMSSYQTYPMAIGYHEPTYVDRGDGNFLLDCFSFLFGDGDPNQGLEEREWQLIAQVIRQNNGVVASEQLAPYTGADPKKEDRVLPVLVRFNGKPEVSDTGNIVYVFPSMQVSAAAYYEDELPNFLREWPWQFSHVPFESLLPVLCVAAINFFGALWLWSHMAVVPILHSLAPLIIVLLVYGTMFIGVPLIRFLVIQVLNSRIGKRNGERQQYAGLLSAPTNDLERKLLEAKQYQVKDFTIAKDDVAYTTDKDVLDQEFDAREFDASP